MAIEYAEHVDIGHLCTGTEATFDVEVFGTLATSSVQALISHHRLACVANDHKDAITIILLGQLVDFLRLKQLVDRIRLGEVFVIDLVEIAKLK